MKSGFVYGKTYRAILIGLLGLLAILAGILTYDLYQLRNYLPIATLDFPEDNLIKINSANIYSFDQAVSPNDQLTLMLNVTNKNSTRFYVEPKIYLDVGGEVLKKREDFEPIQLGINYTGVLPPYTFFAANEGQNNVRIVLAILSFNGTFIKYENATTSFSVLSTSDKLLHDQNNTVLLGVIFSGIIGTATVVALFGTKRSSDRHARELKDSNKFLKEQNEISTKQIDMLQKQNEMYKDQFKLQNRPWITFLEPMPVFTVFEDKTSIPYLDYAKNPTGYNKKILGISFSLDIKNIGNLPTRKVILHKLDISTKPTRTDIITNGDTVNPFPLDPQEKIAIKFFVLTEYWNVRHDTPYYFGLHVEYEIEKGKTDKKGKIWSVQTGGTGTEDSWTLDN